MSAESSLGNINTLKTQQINFTKDSHLSERQLLAVIGDEDTVTGLLLAGIGYKDSQQKKNFFIVDHKTEVSAIEQNFKALTERNDIGILIINQHIANLIRPFIDDYHKPFPSLLEIPSKDNPYDPEKDSVMKRVKSLVSSD